MKTIQKLLCLVLLVALLLPGVIMLVNATDGDEAAAGASGSTIENLYDPSKVVHGFVRNDIRKVSTIAGDLKYAAFYTTDVINVQPGQVITMGPVVPALYKYHVSTETGLFGYVWGETGNTAINDPNGDGIDDRIGMTTTVEETNQETGETTSTTHNTLTEVGTINNQAKIYTYTIPEGIYRIRISVPDVFRDCMVITADDVFTAEEYFAYMEEQDVNIDFLRPAKEITDRKIKNLFPVSDEVNLGYYKEGSFKSHSSIVSYQYDDVQAGDVFYFVHKKDNGAILVDAKFDTGKYENAKKTQQQCFKIFELDEIDDTYCIYAYVVSRGVESVTIMQPKDRYEAGLTLVTKNQPFNAKMYREYVGIGIEDVITENLSDTVTHSARYIKTSGTMTADSYYPQYFDATSTIAVNPGDKISIGPVPRGYYVHYSLYLYGSNGKIINSGYKRLYAVAEETGTISNNMVVYTYTVPEDESVTGIRVQLPQRYAYQRVGEENICRVLITRDYQFSGEEYLEYMKAVKGIDVKFIDDVASLADPKTDLANANLFEITKDNAYMSGGEEKSSTAYCYCTIGDTLAAGDVLYFVSSNLAAVNAKNKSVLVDVKYTGGALVEKTEDVIYCEDLGNGLGIFAFIVTEGVEQVSINVRKTLVDGVDASILADPATEMLITKNLRFDKTMYRKFLGYEITEQENLYDADSLVHGFPAGTYGNYVTDEERNGNWYTAEFEVTPGSSITIGPVFYDVRNYFGFGYPEDNSYKASAKIGQAQSELMVEEETILGRAKIYTYRVRSTAAGDSYDVVKVRLAVPAIFADCTLVTENYAFTAKEYLEYMDAKGVYVDFLKADAGDAANITKNWFDKNDGYDTAKYPYKSDATGTLNTGAVDRARTRVWTVGDGEGQLKVGDVIYFVANDYGNGNSYNLFNMWFDGDERHPYAYLNTKQSNFSSDYESVAMGIEDLGRGFSIYAVRVPEGATQVAVTVPSGLYEDGISLMTVNEPFSGETWKEMFDIEERLKEEEDTHDYYSPLNGLTGLFIGDSISAATHDSKSYLDDPDYWAGWAGGIAASTGMISTNKSNSGAKISYSGKENSDWIWHQQNTVKDQQFDVVVMQGGVNDAGSSSILLGEIRSVDTTIEALRADEVCSTYLGGLQLLFASTKANWPNAEHFFIANYKLSGNKATSGQRENLGEWFAQAKILCEMYGVHFIDLYNNEELTTALKIEGDTREYIHDGTHPNMAAYDIITPYIQREIEAVMCDDEHHDFSVAEKDETYHYDACSYCGAADEVTKTAHTLTYDKNETSHWTECACGYKTEAVEHVYGEPDVSEDGLTQTKSCECGYSVTENVEVSCSHKYDNACDTNCNLCGEVRETSHIPGAAADCTTAQTCTVCGAELKAALGHTPGAAATCTTAQTCTVCRSELAEALGHKYDSVVTAPTCTEKGYTTNTCSVCGDTYVDTYVEATGHTAGEAATCTKAQTCTVCGEQLKAALGHTAGAEADCTNAQTCTVCGEQLKAALGHKYDSVVTAPTCTEKGYTTNTCSVCGDTYVDTYVDATGHSAGEAATCTKAQTCTVCGAELAEELGHKYESVVTDPTCTEKGYTTYTCSACGDSYVADYVDANGHTAGAEADCTNAQTCTVCGAELAEELGHKYESVVTDPTCTEKGYTTYTCSACGDSYVDDYVDANGHTAGAEADCTNAQTCTVCGEEIAPATGHTPGAAADCTNAQTCIVCGAEIAPATGHTPGAEATCTEAQTCTVCGAELAEATGHRFSSVVTESATCTKEGYITITCGNCGEVFVSTNNGVKGDPEADQYLIDYPFFNLAPKGHSYDAVVTDPTCTEEGYTTNTCSACGDSYVDTYVDATGHRFSSVVTESATCTKEGYITITCGNCGEVFVSSNNGVEGDPEADQYLIDYPFFNLAPKGHSYDAVVTAPTCTEEGYTTYTCSVCGDTYVDTYVDATGHSYDAVVTDPTCTEEGYTTYTCSVCGDTYVDNTVAALGHTYEGKYDENGHWTECACGDKTEANEHVYDDGEFDIACDCGYVVPGEFVQKEDGLYYLFDGKFNWTQAGLHKIDGDYYFVTSTGKCKTGVYYAWQTYCDLPCGNYEFGEDGKMLQGLVEKADGIYYYVNGKVPAAGLYEVDGDYYFVTTTGKCKTGAYYAWETHCDLPCGNYEFGEDGKMIR